MIQFVPLLTSVTDDPYAAADKIAVPGVVELIGTTLDEAELTAPVLTFLQ